MPGPPSKIKKLEEQLHHHRIALAACFAVLKKSKGGIPGALGEEVGLAMSKARAFLDHCELCNGTKGGVPGNENIIDGVVMCDYCTPVKSMRLGEQHGESKDMGTSGTHYRRSDRPASAAS